MAKKYSAGFSIPTSIGTSSAEPNDDRFAVTDINDLKTLEYAYSNIEVHVDHPDYLTEEGLYRSFIWNGQTQTDLSNWIDKETLLKQRVINLEDNQNTGVATYDTVALLPVTGVTTVSYKVTNDPTPANNGYYSWNGASYDQEAPFYATIFDALDNVNASTMKATSDYISAELDVEKATNGDVLENSTKQHNGGQIFDQVKAELFDATPTSGSTNAVTSNGVFDALALKADKTALVNNQFIPTEGFDFIKELYITGWNSGDIFLSGFTNTDAGGTVSFHFRNSADARIIYSYQLTANQTIYPLLLSGDAAGSGFGGYMVIDWSKTITIVQGSTRLPVNEKAKLLQNSPFIADYINSINDRVYTDTAEADANNYTDAKTATILVDSIYQSKANINQKVFADTANHPNIDDLKNFVLDIKADFGFVDTEQYFISAIGRFSYDVNNALYNYLIFQIKRVSDNERVFYGGIFDIDTFTGISTHLFNASSIQFRATLNWDALYFLTGGVSSNQTLLDNASFFGTSFQELVDNRHSEIELKQFYENYNFASSDFGFTATTNATITPSYTQNQGITFDFVNYGSGFITLNSVENYIFRAKDYIMVSVKYKVNSENMTFGGGLPSSVGGNNAAGFNIRLVRSGVAGVATFGGEFVTGKYRTETKVIRMPDNSPVSGEYKLAIRTDMTLLENKGIDLNYTIEELSLYFLGNEDNPKDKEFVESLKPQSFDNFLNVVDAKNPSEPKNIIKYAQIASRLSNWYSDKTMFVYSASVWETQIQGRYIAEKTGMEYNDTIARLGIDGFRRTTFGGSQLTPVIVGSASKNAGDSHFARIINGWEHYVANYGSEAGNVVFLPFGYNHPGANPSTGNMKPFISGGTAIEDDTYGLDRANHPPFKEYVNFEFDLVTNPTTPMRTYDVNGVATNNGVPSYGSCLRGIVEFILEKDPTCEVFIPTVYYTDGYDELTRRLFDNLISVNIQVAKEYGFSSPRVDLRAGVNAQTKLRLLKDSIHPNYIVGIRSAMACLAEMGVSV